MNMKEFMTKIVQSDNTAYYPISPMIEGFKKRTARKNASISIAVTDPVVDMINPINPTHVAVMVLMTIEEHDKLTARESKE